MNELEKLLELKKKLYAKKTEKLSTHSGQHKVDQPKATLKARGIVVVGQSGLALKLLDRTGIFPRPIELEPRGLPLKLGQVLEVVLVHVGKKWRVEIAYEQLYKDVCLDQREDLSNTALMLASMNLPPKGKEATTLDKFFVRSLWVKRLLAMGILNKKSYEDLSLLNAFGSLLWGDPPLDKLKSLLDAPFKAKKVKHSPLYWYIIPFETSWELTKRRGSLNLAFKGKDFTYAGLKQWSLVFPLAYDCLILQVQEGGLRLLKLTLPSQWIKREEELLKIKEHWFNRGLGLLSYHFLDLPSQSVDVWEERFILNE